MPIAISVIISLVLVTATVLLHYELLQFAAGLPNRLTSPKRSRVLIVLAVVLAAHVLEAGLYALAYYLMQTHLGLGALSGHLEGGTLDYFYFSIATYTTLGIGDLHPSRRPAPRGWNRVPERPCAHRLVGFVHLPHDGGVLGDETGCSIGEGRDVNEIALQAVPKG